MKPGTVRFLAALPVVGYAELTILGSHIPWTALVASAATATALPVLFVIPWVRHARRAPLGLAFTIVGILLTAAAISPRETVIGAVVGLPVGLLGYLFVTRASFIAAPMNLAIALTLGLFDVAIKRYLPTAPTAGPLPVDAWNSAIAAVATGEGQALGQGIGGGPFATAPLSISGDVTFDSLAWLALAGMLLSMLFLSERAVRLPASSGDRAQEQWLRDEARHRHSRFRPPLPPPPGAPTIPESAYLFSGVASLSVTAVAETAFGVATYFSLGGAMVGLGIGVVLVFLGLAVTPRPAAPRSRPLVDRPARVPVSGRAARANPRSSPPDPTLA
jgi:hypothetical protein